ncbi:3-oxoadipate enol-lactonase 2 [Geodia barretti]|uniref:3-oxoadipate enol-lactonase 2 n=1 Tax=Geodia barretti TaxID=519541 RepID=A0AA35X2E7_GEOBA|nr:3-oxoadipate enol-lactonase 2 [Geodia barretti]
MPTIQREHAQLHYYLDDFTDPWRRSPDAIVLQHGFSRNGNFWYNWPPLLGREYRVIRPDLRGMGASTADAEHYQPTLDVLMDDLLAILDHEGVEKAVYVGESFGGIMGMQFAHDHPDRCRALVLCNSPCRLSRRESQTPGGSWLATMEQGGIGAWSAATINFRLDMRHADEGLKDWYIAEMDKTNPEFGQALHRYLDSLDFGPHLKDITVPTLLLTGDESPTTSMEQQQFMAAEIPNSELTVYPGLGHGINAIYPEWCVDRMREFLGLQS